MSYTSIGRTTSTHRLMKYLEGEEGDRLAAYSGLDPMRFANLAHKLARKGARTVEAYTIVQSFPQDEFDPNNPADVERVNALGVELAKRLYGENALFAVSTHVDGSGGCVHNHIAVINYDPETQKSMQKGRSLAAVRTVNDQVMRENGLSVIEKEQRQGTWEEAKQKWKETETQRLIGERVAKALLAAYTAEQFKDNLEKEGVELVEWEKEGVEGYTYKARVNGRMRRAKANKLCDEFTPKGIEQHFAQVKQPVFVEIEDDQDEWEEEEEQYAQLDVPEDCAPISYDDENGYEFGG